LRVIENVIEFLALFLIASGVVTAYKLVLLLCCSY